MKRRTELQGALFIGAVALAVACGNDRNDSPTAGNAEQSVEKEGATIQDLDTAPQSAASVSHDAFHCGLKHPRRNATPAPETDHLGLVRSHVPTKLYSIDPPADLYTSRPVPASELALQGTYLARVDALIAKYGADSPVLQNEMKAAKRDVFGR